MAIQTIANQLRSLRDRYWSLVADALRDVEQAFTNVYRDMGWFESGNVSGIRKDVLQTPRLMIVGGKNNAPIGEIRSIDGRFVVLLDPNASSGALNVESKSPLTKERMRLTPTGIGIYDVNDQLLYAISAYQDIGSGSDVVTVVGQTEDGAEAVFEFQANPLWARLQNTYKDAVDGDTVTTLKSEEAAGTLSVKKGADNEISAVADAAAVVLTVKNASADSTVKPESVVTPRLGVGGSAPGTDGHASVSTFLGVGRSTPTGAETLGVTGDVDVAGALDVSGAITNPLLTNEFVIALLGGTLSSESASSHRTNLDVYSKAEVEAEIDARIAAAIASLSIDAVGDHTHGGAVSDDGGHTHTITYTP